MWGILSPRTKAERVFEKLRKAGKGGVSNGELNKITFRYGAVICELRKDGYDIRTKKVGKNGLFIYYMEEK